MLITSLILSDLVLSEPTTLKLHIKKMFTQKRSKLGDSVRTVFGRVFCGDTGKKEKSKKGKKDINAGASATEALDTPPINMDVLKTARETFLSSYQKRVRRGELNGLTHLSIDDALLSNEGNDWTESQAYLTFLVMCQNAFTRHSVKIITSISTYDEQVQSLRVLSRETEAWLMSVVSYYCLKSYHILMNEF